MKNSYSSTHYTRNREAILLKARLDRESNKGRYRRLADELAAKLKIRRNENRAYFLEKLGGKCEDCGYDKYPYVLEFAHKDPMEKECNIAMLLATPNRDKIWAEVQKCRILCANCHKVETTEKRHFGRPRKYPRAVGE